MKVLALLLALVALTHAAPQHRMSSQAYNAFKVALSGRIPVALYSAKRSYRGYGDESDGVVVINFPGLGNQAGAYSADSDDFGAAVGRTGLAAVGVQDLVRRKRQTSDSSNVQQLSFSVSTLGSILGVTVGKWLDSTFNANVELIDNMEVIGTLVVDQVSNMLDEPKDKFFANDNTSSSEH